MRRSTILVGVLLAAACGGTSDGGSTPSTPTTPTTPVLTPASIRIQSGDAQNGTVGRALTAPVSVAVTTASGQAVAGAAVTFSVVAGGGTVASGNATTDAAGIASITWTLGFSVGDQTLSAAVANVSPVQFKATAHPLLSAVAPQPFVVGDTVAIRGRGLAGLPVTLSGAAMATIGSSDTLVRFVAPASLPACTSPLPSVTIVVGAGAIATETSAQTAGAPIAGPSATGAHAVLPSAGRGCRVTLTAGTYGVAVYTTAMQAQVPTFGNLNHRDSVTHTYPLRVTPGTSAAASVARAALERTTILRSPAMTRPERGAVDVAWPRASDVLRVSAAPCQRPALAVGDSVFILSGSSRAPERFHSPVDSVAWYRTYAASAHYAIVGRRALIDTLPPLARARIDSALTIIEKEVYPFLVATYGSLPDLDSNGQLIVLLDIAGGFYIPGGARYRDGGCATGDFINVADQNISTAGSTEFLFTQSLTVEHESTHWVDFELHAGGTSAVSPYWSIEGLATLSEQLFLSSGAGKPLWTANWRDNIPYQNASYSIKVPLQCFTQSGYYADRGAFDGIAYLSGCGMLDYLVDQRRREGADPSAVMQLMPKRVSAGELRPVWEALGGANRTEDELQAEYLLAHYADDVVPGSSGRLSIGAYDFGALRSANRFPFPLKTIDGTVASETLLGLQMPDGLVVEVKVPAGGATLSLGNAASNLGMAIVRRGP